MASKYSIMIISILHSSFTTLHDENHPSMKQQQHTKKANIKLMPKSEVNYNVNFKLLLALKAEL